MGDLILDPRIGRMAAELAGVDGVRVWHDQALIKRPYANPTAFHLDAPYWSFTSRDAISIWIALDDATEANGCLYFFPGSHLETTIENVKIGQNVGAIFDVYPQFADRPAASGAMTRWELLVPQRADRSRRRRQHDERPAASDDVCVHARRCGLQRAAEHSERGPGCRAACGRSPRRPRAEPARVPGTVVEVSPAPARAVGVSRRRSTR